MENHYLQWSGVQEWTTVCTKAFSNQHWCKFTAIFMKTLGAVTAWTLISWVWSLFHLSICLYPSYRGLLCSLFFFTGSYLGLQHNQTLHPCFIFNDSACAQTNSTLKHSWVEDVMQLILVDLAAGYSLSPCAYLPKPGGDSMQLMHTETQCANMWRFAKWHTSLPPSLGWQNRESKFGQRARTLIFADQISSMFNRCRPMGHGPNDGTLWLCSELI